ncbi:MAG: pitrilysin family protein [Candidatus Rokuibacteriota bacterium]
MTRSAWRRAVSWLATALLVTACAGSGARSTAPAAGGTAEADLPPPARSVLRNGMRLIVQDHRASDIVAIYLFVGVGVRHEAPDQLGYAHFQEHMLFKGTDRFGPGYVDRTVEGVGGRSNAVTSFDYTSFYLVLPSDATTTGIELLADMAFRSAFVPDEIGREREVIFEEARIEQDNPRTAVVRQLYGLVFAGNPYGRPVLGTRETMQAATQERLRAFNRRYYVPENMTLVVAGPVDAAAVRVVVERVFGRMPATGYKPTPAPAPRPLNAGVRRTVERPEEQAHLALGWPAPRSDDRNGDAVDLLATILAGTESSRLAQRLRDQERLVSSVTMSYAALMGGGIVSLRAELEAKDLERVERVILEEIARMQESGPTEEERRLAVTKFEAQHAFDTETSEGLAYAYGLAETTWTLEAELRYVDRLRRVTREQIRDAARRYLSRTNYARLAFVPKPEGR